MYILIKNCSFPYSQKYEENINIYLLFSGKDQSIHSKYSPLSIKMERGHVFVIFLEINLFSFCIIIVKKLEKNEE